MKKVNIILIISCTSPQVSAVRKLKVKPLIQSYPDLLINF